MKKIKFNISENTRYIYIILFVIIFIAAIAYIFPNKGRFKYTFYSGKPWVYEELIAPFDFPILKSQEELDTEKKNIIDNRMLFFRNDSTAAKSMKDNFIISLKNVQLFKDLEQQNKDKILAGGFIILDSIVNKGIIESGELLKNKPDNYKITVIENSKAFVFEIGKFFTIKTAQDYIDDKVVPIEIKYGQFVGSALKRSLDWNIIFDKYMSDIVLDDDLNKISNTRGLVQANERVISAGEIVTPEKFRVLSSLRHYYEDSSSNNNKFVSITIGQTIIVSILLLIVVIFIHFNYPKLSYDRRRLLFIGLVSMVGIISMILMIDKAPALVYINPILIVPIIIRAFTDSRVSFMVHFTLIMMLGLIAPDGFNFIMIQLIAGYAAILSYYNLHKRSQFLIISFVAFLTYSLTYFGLFLIQSPTLKDIDLLMFFYFGINAILLMLSYPLIFICEKIFGMTTDMTFMELSDINNPLLRELSQTAPGTFQHSVMVSNIAEDIVREIGGNPLLIRAGAMYHDIGKVENAQFFTENQHGSFNPHDNLSPEESAKIIIDHTVQGINIARKYRLPEDVIDFIRTHHGTKRTEYFYRMALKENPESVNKDDFTYRGPVPTTKEQCVLMICDTVEAASKSLQSPDEKRINDLVEKLVDDMIDDGQFSKADIKLKDLSKIKKILKSKLASIYHLRIAYPDKK